MVNTQTRALHGYDGLHLGVHQLARALCNLRLVRKDQAAEVSIVTHAQRLSIQAVLSTISR